MRPKRQILLYCPDEISSSLLRFQIETWGYAVTLTGEMGDMRRLVLNADISVAMLVPSLPLLPEFSRATRSLDILLRHRGVPLRLLDLRNVLPIASIPSIHRVESRPYSPSGLRETLRVLSIRRRGPKPVRGHAPQRRVAA